MTKSSPETGLSEEFVQLRSMIVSACIAAWSPIRAAHSHENFYGFALMTDDTCNSLGPSCNSTQGLERMIARYKDKKFNVSNAYLRWCPFDWYFLSRGIDEFSPALTRMFKLNEQMVAQMGSDDGGDTFRLHARATMMLALAELNSEGYFGKGEERVRVILMCSIYDSGGAILFEQESARRLNPPEAYQSFRREWFSYQSEMDQRRAERSQSEYAAAYDCFFG